jgi:ferritin-like metal-binding protein YciE
MALKNLDDLFLHTLKDILYAEKQILKALPKMAKKASTDELRQAFETHRDETQGQVERLERVFDMIDKTPRGAKCEAILGIIEEAEELMEEAGDDEVRDAAMLAAAQAVEHYEIARYGTLCAFAKQLGHDEAAKVLAETLREEEATDKKLSKLAEQRVNKKAA